MRASLSPALELTEESEDAADGVSDGGVCEGAG